MSDRAPRILSAQDGFVRQLLRDFRVNENGQMWIARMRGEGKFRSAVFPGTDERQVLVELIPIANWERPGFLHRWLTALRLPYLLFSLLPLLLVVSHSVHIGSRPSAPYTALLFASLILIHLGCNLWSDYEDHLRGVDSPEHSGGSGVIQKLWIPAVHIRNCAAVFFLSGCALGLALLAQQPWAIVGSYLLWLGLAGAFGAASYSGWPFHYKYLGLGEPIVFFLSGPIVTMGASLIYSHDTEHLLWYALVSLPLSFLAVLRLHGGNMQRAPFDAISGVFTVARYLGFRFSKVAYGFLFLAPFFVTSTLWVTNHVSTLQFLVALVTLHPALFSLLPLRHAKGPLDPAFHYLRKNAVRLHFSFGLLYSLSFLFS